MYTEWTVKWMKTASRTARVPSVPRCPERFAKRCAACDSCLATFLGGVGPWPNTHSIWAKVYKSTEISRNFKI